MLLKKPFTEPWKYTIACIDAVTSHQIPYNPYVPLLYKQTIEITPEKFPEKPPDKSQLYRSLHPPQEKPWEGGVPVGRIKEIPELKHTRLDIKQYKHRLVMKAYNPPLSVKFPWEDSGSREKAFEDAKTTQTAFNDKYGSWRNQHRVSYCELSDSYFLQVRVNHMFPECLFECDLEDIGMIFSYDWYMYSVKFTDKWEDKKYHYRLVLKHLENSKWKKGETLTRMMIPKGKVLQYDNNLLNFRRNNLILSKDESPSA